MKKLFKIIVEHYSQKDSHEAVETFLLAESDELVYDWVDKKNYGLYSDRNEEYESIGVESYKEKMLRLGGEFFEDELELHDLYYGATIYGWKEVVVETSLLPSVIEALVNIGILIEIEKETEK